MGRETNARRLGQARHLLERPQRCMHLLGGVRSKWLGRGGVLPFFFLLPHLVFNSSPRPTIRTQEILAAPLSHLPSALSPPFSRLPGRLGIIERRAVAGRQGSELLLHAAHLSGSENPVVLVSPARREGAQDASRRRENMSSELSLMQTVRIGPQDHHPHSAGKWLIPLSNAGSAVAR